MKIEGTYEFDAPRAAVWQAVMDPEVIAKIMPGCEKLDVVGENAYEGAMKIKVGPVQGLFKGNVELSDIQEPESYKLQMKGKGAPGFVNANGDLHLVENDGKTTLEYVIDAKIGGRLASVGQRLLDSSTRVISRQSLEGLEKEVMAIKDDFEDYQHDARYNEEGIPQVYQAASVAHGTFEDMVPEALRPAVGIATGFVAGGGLFLVLMLFFFQACGIRNI